MVVEADAVDGARKVNDSLAHQHFSGLRLGAEPSCEVERAAAVAAVDLDSLARVEPNANEQRHRRVELHLVGERELQRDRGTDRDRGERKTASASSPARSPAAVSSTPSR